MNARVLPISGSRPRCTGETKAGKPCRHFAAWGDHRCWQHGGGQKGPAAAQMGQSPKPRAPLAEMLAEIKDQMAQAAPEALKAVMDVLKDEGARAADRLKAAELVLSRTVGTKVEAEVTSHEHRDIDTEIEDALEYMQMQQENEQQAAAS